jgi:hypothetical protein
MNIKRSKEKCHMDIAVLTEALESLKKITLKDLL